MSKGIRVTKSLIQLAMSASAHQTICYQLPPLYVMPDELELDDPGQHHADLSRLRPGSSGVSCATSNTPPEQRVERRFAAQDFHAQTTTLASHRW